MHCIGDVKDEFVISAEMFADQTRVYEQGSSLPSAFKVKQRSPALERVSNLHFGAIPARTSVIRRVGIATVISIEGVGHCGWFKRRNLAAVPDFPRTSERAF